MLVVAGSDEPDRLRSTQHLRRTEGERARERRRERENMGRGSHQVVQGNVAIVGPRAGIRFHPQQLVAQIEIEGGGSVVEESPADIY